MKSFEKTFANLVDDYIEEKRAVGYGFHKAAQVLRRIVQLQNEVDHSSPRLSVDLVSRWCEKRPWENETNRSHRISVLRGLGAYMARMGYDACMVPHRMAPQRDYLYIPYIFSKQELGKILGSIDCLCKTGISAHSDQVFPIIFRILIGSGTRITETLCIKKTDLDLENGTLFLRQTKNAKERIIPIAASLVEKCRRYEMKCLMIPGFSSSPWYFPNRHGLPYHSRTAYQVFRKALSRAGISHGGKGKGPRLHDLRHTYAVRVLNKWVLERKNLTTALPYLATYMGHEGLKAAQHYLRLTATMFPELIQTVEKAYGWVIPEAYHE